MVIGWFSCGITSAVACKLALEKYGPKGVRLFYLEIDTAHEDNERFIKDCERWYGVPIERRRSKKYVDQFDVIRKDKYINGPAGARCTLMLKKKVRQAIEKEVAHDRQVFGFEHSLKEINRAVRFSEQYPEANGYYPLIEQKLTKAECADILLRNDIRLPAMYELGFHNNNCIGCVKGGKGYWNHVRKKFPEKFEQMAQLEKEVGRSCINGTYLQDLKPNEGKHEPPILPDCGTFCEIEFAHIIDDRARAVYEANLSINQLKLF